MGGYVYILSNRPDGVLYVGVTNDIVRRVFEHREGAVKGFSKTHNLKTSSTMNSSMIFTLPFSARRTSNTGLAHGRFA